MPQGPNEGEEFSGLVKRGKGVLAGLAFLGVVKTMQKNAESQDEPGIDQMDPVVLALAAQARDLAQGETTEEESVRDLVQAAGSQVRNLSKAAASVRFNGAARESWVADRANRLLLAAFSGEPVRQLTPEQQQWFERMDAIWSVRVEEAFPKLIDIQPKLRALEAEFSPRSISDADKESIWNDLLEKLASVVGPEAESDDPVVRSHGAYNAARLYLAVRVGLLEEVDYT